MAIAESNSSVLSYADLPARLGISYDFRPGGARIEIPAAHSGSLAWVVGVVLMAISMGLILLLGGWGP
jgi:hypothetical protein